MARTEVIVIHFIQLLPCCARVTSSKYATWLVIVSDLDAKPLDLKVLIHYDKAVDAC